MKLVISFVGAGAALLACACSSAEPRPQKFEILVDRENRSTSISCECNSSGFDDAAECATERTPSELERSCKLDAYSTMEGGGHVIDCVSTAHRAFADCHSSYGCDHLSACNDLFDSLVSECPEEREVRNECFFIDCPSGEFVSASRQCDGVQDCSDGFDEASCAIAAGS